MKKGKGSFGWIAAAFAAAIVLYKLLRRYVGSADRITDKIDDMLSITKDTGKLIFDAAYQRLLRRFPDQRAKTLAGLMVAQSRYETADYTSRVFKENKNAFGYKYYAGSIYQVSAGRMSPEGNAYAKFATVQDSAREVADWICRRVSDFKDIDSVDGYAAALKRNDYYGEATYAYAAGIDKYLNA